MKFYSLRFLHTIIITVGILFLVANNPSFANQQILERIKQKSETAKTKVLERVNNGENVLEIIQQLKRVPILMQKGKIHQTEKLLDLALKQLNQPISNNYSPDHLITNEFSNPQLVKILGYNQDSMEPFISRDGKYLFFNNLNDWPRINTNIYYAEKINDKTFQFKGEVKGVNTKFLEGVPSLDNHGNFYFVTNRTYLKDHKMIHVGNFNNGIVTNVHPVKGNIIPYKPMWFNMDVEISADGQTLYFTQNKFRGQKGKGPETSNFMIAKKKGDKFITLKNSNNIFKEINTKKLEYAASISENNLELYFSRALVNITGNQLQGVDLSILKASRKNENAPFDKPEIIANISGFFEAPTIAPDNKTLYYHKKVGNRFHIFMVQRD